MSNITQTLTVFDPTKLPAEGQGHLVFRTNATYAWTTFKDVILEWNTAVGQFNTVADEVNTNTQIATTKAEEASQSASAAAQSVTVAEQHKTAAEDAKTAAQNAQAAAEAIFDNFDDRYLGPKATAPTVDNDGDPLEMGALYFNTASGRLYIYDDILLTWIDLSYVPTLLSSLSDIALTSLSQGQVLRYNSTTEKWENYTLNISDVSGLEDALSAESLLTKIKSVDGSGSGLDADTLDGLNSTYFRVSPQTTQEDPNITEDLYILTNHANSPVSGIYWHIRTQFYANTSGSCAQIAIQYSGGNAVYARSRFSGSWTAWVRLDNNGYATSTVGGTVKARLSGTTLYLTTNGNNA